MVLALQTQLNKNVMKKIVNNKTIPINTIVTIEDYLRGFRKITQKQNRLKLTKVK